jgi:hypothetical protein
MCSERPDSRSTVVPLERLDHVAHGVRLAGPGRAVHEQAALEVLAGCTQLLAPRGHVQAVPLHPAQHLLGQHHVRARGGRQAGEDDLHAERTGLQLEDLAAVDVQARLQLGQLPEQGLRLVGGQSGDLDREALTLLRVRSLDEEHRPTASVLHQQQALPEAGQRPPRAGRQVHQVRRAQADRRQPVAVLQHLQRDGAVVRRHHQPVHLHLPAVLGPPGVQRDLQVDVLERRQVPADHGVLQARLAQPAADQRDDLVALVRGTGWCTHSSMAVKAWANARASSSLAGTGGLLSQEGQASRSVADGKRVRRGAGRSSGTRSSGARTP